MIQQLTRAKRGFAGVLFGLALALSGCGDDSPKAPVRAPTPFAVGSDIVLGAQTAGVTPFIAFVNLVGGSVFLLDKVSYTVEPMPGTVSRPVHVEYTITSLRNRGRIAGSMVSLPVFGLYADRTNTATIKLQFIDGSVQTLSAAVPTAPYSIQSPFNTPTFDMARQPGTALGFDFFAIKPARAAPITVIDSDGFVRWRSATETSTPVLFRNNGFDSSDGATPFLLRDELDGSTNRLALSDPSITRLFHDFTQGPQGILAMPDYADREEDVMIEITPQGQILKTWDMIQIIGDFMRANGDDPSTLVRRGVDWFHVNSAIYDPRDNSLIISSRELFVIKIDYDTGAIKWILGDPEKYWYSFPSLRSKALTLPAGAVVPIGQHSVSITPDGQLMMFNNGFASLNGLPGTPVGASLTYSPVIGYFIDPVAMTARPGLFYDAGQSIYSSICSSAYLSPDGSMLIQYSQDKGGTVLRMRGLNPQQQIVFDIAYPATFGCTSGWNAVIVPMEDIRFTD